MWDALQIYQEYFNMWKIQSHHGIPQLKKKLVLLLLCHFCSIKATTEPLAFIQRAAKLVGSQEFTSDKGLNRMNMTK